LLFDQLLKVLSAFQRVEKMLSKFARSSGALKDIPARLTLSDTGRKLDDSGRIILAGSDIVPNAQKSHLVSVADLLSEVVAGDALATGEECQGGLHDLPFGYDWLGRHDCPRDAVRHELFAIVHSPFLNPNEAVT
jgi:hypothetical protein